MSEKEIKTLANQMRVAMKLHLEGGESAPAAVRSAIPDASPMREHLMQLMLYNLNWTFIEKWIEEVNLDE